MFSALAWLGAGFALSIVLHAGHALAQQAPPGWAVAQASEAQREDTFWDDTRSVDNTEAYGAYLEAYPNGRYARLARAYIARLKSGVAATAAAPGAVRQPAPAAPSAPSRPLTTPPGLSLRDCPDCPELMVLPAGTFTMGSSPDEQQLVVLRADSLDTLKSELPQHGVNIASFGIGVQSVTRAQFAAFVRATKYQTDAEKAGGCSIWQDNRYQRQFDRNWLNPGFAQADDHPVVCVSWNDAQAYVQWLSQLSGRAYRLPSEAEREYAARANQATHFWWGDRIGTDQANYNGNFSYHRSARGEFRQKTMPGNSFKANPFGLFGMHGNVYEWVEDCWHIDYNGAPATGAAWRLNCARPEHVRRGGSWLSNPVYLRSAYRARGAADLRESGTGFRVAVGG